MSTISDQVSIKDLTLIQDQLVKGAAKLVQVDDEVSIVSFTSFSLDESTAPPTIKETTNRRALSKEILDAMAESCGKQKKIAEQVVADFVKAEEAIAEIRLKIKTGNEAKVDVSTS